MPYDLLTKGSPIAIIAIILAFLLKSYIDSSNKEKDNYHKLVDNVRVESREREDRLLKTLEENQEHEDKLMRELGRYNDSLQQISENIKVIPAIQADISYLKQKVR